MKPSYRAIIISPHLDDAVFSCGGIISQLLKDGPVLVINIFTKYLSDMKFHGVVMGEERYQEEKNVAKFLGYEFRNLDELDAIFRRKAYQKISKIFNPPIAEDLQWLPSLREKIFAILDEYDFQQIFIPLGIGWHVDHILTHMVFEPMFGNDKVSFYEDIPYGLVSHTTRYRLNEVANYHRRDKDLSLAPINEFKAWWQTTKSFNKTAMMTNIKPWIIRIFALPVVSIFLYRLMALHRKNFKKKKLVSLKSKEVVINVQFERKLEAMTLYKSQFKEFFSSREECGNFLRAYGASINIGPEAIERFWVFDENSSSEINTEITFNGGKGKPNNLQSGNS